MDIDALVNKAPFVHLLLVISVPRGKQKMKKKAKKAFGAF